MRNWIMFRWTFPPIAVVGTFFLGRYPRKWVHADYPEDVIVLVLVVAIFIFSYVFWASRMNDDGADGRMGAIMICALTGSIARVFLADILPGSEHIPIGLLTLPILYEWGRLWRRRAEYQANKEQRQQEREFLKREKSSTMLM